MMDVKRPAILLLLILAGCALEAQDRRLSLPEQIALYQLDPAAVTIHISKLGHTLTLSIGDHTLREYPCVFGGDPVSDKKYEGDQCTPEGTFHVLSKYPHRSWEKFIWIDYPTADSRRKYEANRRRGQIPGGRGIGGSIGIHGVPDHHDYLIDKSINWTLGCISLRTADINEIYQYVHAGTEVVIAK
ncbi:MAG: L,D-transpeptidase [Bacteroidetes bacterium]|nr:L,D-transpeptidase [Bacteroidota bacterium]